MQDILAVQKNIELQKRAHKEEIRVAHDGQP